MVLTRVDIQYDIDTFCVRHGHMYLHRISFFFIIITSFIVLCGVLCFIFGLKFLLRSSKYPTLRNNVSVVVGNGHVVEF